MKIASLVGRPARRWRRLPPLRWASLVLLCGVALIGCGVAAWFTGVGQIDDIFQRLAQLQASPPLWLMVPMVSSRFLLAPAVILFAITWGITWAVPQPRTWSRFVVVAILLILTTRYILWRGLTTLNLATPANGVVSLGLFALEMLILAATTIQLFLMVLAHDRRAEADRHAIAVQQGTYRPAVDVLIPTYNEPDFILRRTIIGCQALDYEPKHIYLLDDTRRPEVAALAQELGCGYLTRPDNRHAKAGNLNHALARTQGELIAVFDADFVPTRNFLNRTVGFFQDERVALVQTPQSFYNPDPIAWNLGLEQVLTPEEEVFYRQIQLMRDGAGSVICSGTSFVVRRQPLEALGGFVTESLSEDYFTGVRLSAAGHRLVYLQEKLSAGLAAEDIASQISQRVRWAQGTLQAFFIAANPLTIPGLSLIQRLAHLEGLLYWFTCFSRLGFLLAPLAYSFLGVIPIRATPEGLMFYFLPYYLVQLSVFSWLNYRSRSAMLADVYALIQCIPLCVTVVRTLLHPFGRGFQVTPKGLRTEGFRFNWALGWPLLILFGLTALSLWVNLGNCLMMGTWSVNKPELAEGLRGVWLGWFWSGINLLMLGIALLSLLDAPRPDAYPWFGLRRVGCVRAAGRELWGTTTLISEVGARISLTQQLPREFFSPDPVAVTLELLQEKLILKGTVVATDTGNELPTLQIGFCELSLAQQRHLVSLLYGRPGQWPSRTTPGELQSLGILLRALIWPRALFERRLDLQPVAVRQL
ncbi:MAG: glycosyltransferase [Gloeomargaritaceae cyanobacterium C42_A2020_066]|nr:glycosyltransferase [Gloeomargaritaceae cyanobacterium C42_A2020_066]